MAFCCAFQVPTEFGPGQAREIVAKALGRPLSEVFASFDDTPMGVASIGEAHRATLLDGREVVVKVMMNGIEEKFRADLATIIAFCKLAQPQHVLVRAGELFGGSVRVWRRCSLLHVVLLFFYCCSCLFGVVASTTTLLKA